MKLICPDRIDCANKECAHRRPHEHGMACDLSKCSRGREDGRVSSCGPCRPVNKELKDIHEITAKLVMEEAELVKAPFQYECSGDYTRGWVDALRWVLNIPKR